LKEESMSDSVKMKEVMDGYNHTLDLVRFVERKAQPLHRMLKNLYRQNKDFQSQNRKLKEDLQHFQNEVSQRNFQVLVEATIEKETPTTKESIAPLKNPFTAKRNNPINPVVPKEDPLSPRKSVRLSVKLMK
jgi:predicted RNase H-like nuclease (RuvC/YqgF family)